MKRILYIRSSLFEGDGASSQLGEEIVTELMIGNPGSMVTTLDLAAAPLPHLDAAEFGSWQIAPEQRSEEQQALALRSDQLIEELFAHDTLVLAVPMYNLGIPSTLKAWIDRVARAGKTFRYTSSGPKGLLSNMQAYLMFARGGNYQGTPSDTQTGYLKDILGLMGIVDVETVFAEGLARGGDVRKDALEDAHQIILKLAAAATPGVRYAIA